MYFAQQHIRSLNYFKSLNVDYTKIQVDQFPHLKYLNGDTAEFVKYLMASWGTDDMIMINEHFVKVNDLLEDIKVNGIKVKIITTRNVNDNLLIVDGNHRTSISKFLGITLPSKEIPLKQHINTIIKNSNIFYATGNKNMPYQSIVYKNDILVEGRRNDIRERAATFDISDIKDKRVIDFRCNYGMNCFYSYEMGASYVQGVELMDKIVTSAIRLAVCFNYPVDFYKVNLSKDVVNTKFDTGFMFAIDKHVKNDDNLVNNIKSTGLKTLYFETHGGSKKPPTVIIDYFDDMVYLGKTFENRLMYKLIKK